MPTLDQPLEPLKIALKTSFVDAESCPEAINHPGRLMLYGHLDPRFFRSACVKGDARGLKRPTDAPPCNHRIRNLVGDDRLPFASPPADPCSPVQSRTLYEPHFHHATEEARILLKVCPLRIRCVDRDMDNDGFCDVFHTGDLQQLSFRPRHENVSTFAFRAMAPRLTLIEM